MLVFTGIVEAIIWIAWISRYSFPELQETRNCGSKGNSNWPSSFDQSDGISSLSLFLERNKLIPSLKCYEGKGQELHSAKKILQKAELA